MDQHLLLRLLREYRRKGILIDTNLALLYIVGSLDPLLIRSHARTANFTSDDFDRLSRFVDAFEKKVVTPNILTEVGNLLGKMPELRGVFRGFIRKSTEVFLQSGKITETSAFLIVGLTDAGIIEVAKNKYLVVTDDGPLLGLLLSSKVDVVSLSQIRSI